MENTSADSLNEKPAAAATATEEKPKNEWKDLGVFLVKLALIVFVIVADQQMIELCAPSVAGIIQSRPVAPVIPGEPFGYGPGVVPRKACVPKERERHVRTVGLIRAAGDE